MKYRFRWRNIKERFRRWKSRAFWRSRSNFEIGIESVTLQQSSYTMGLDLLSINDTFIIEVGYFFEYCFANINNSRSDKRNITRNPTTLLHGAVYALGTKEDNDEWREHCSTSLRELLHGFMSNGNWYNDVKNIFYAKEERIEQTVDEGVKIVNTYYRYFTGIAHHDVGATINALHALRKDYKLKPEDHTDGLFIDNVRQYLMTLGSIIHSLVEQGKYSQDNHESARNTQ